MFKLNLHHGQILLIKSSLFVSFMAYFVIVYVVFLFKIIMLHNRPTFANCIIITTMYEYDIYSIIFYIAAVTYYTATLNTLCHEDKNIVNMRMP